MAQTNYTPIYLYSSSTTGNSPSASNLGAGELAINYTDGKLFYKDNANAVQVIGWKTTPTTAGGTGLTSYTAGDLPYYASGSALSKLGIGTSGYVLQSNGSAPTWVAQSTLSVGTATNATNTAITDNTSSSATWYPTIVSATTGNLPQTTSSTKLSFVPSTGTLTATNHAGTWAGNTIGTGYGGTGLTSFTANGVVYASSTSALTTGSALVFDGTNLGVGVTPSSWNVGKVIEIGNSGNAFWSAGASNAVITSNVYYNSGYKYASSAPASQYQQYNGSHVWYVAPSGTVGNTITGFATAAMTLDNSGNLLVNTTTNTGNYKTNIYSGSQTTILLQSSTACADVWNNATSGNNVFFTFYTEGSGTARGSITYNRGAGLVAYNVTSDQRLKENITEASSALSKIDSIQIKSFDWIETKNKVDFGVIAQELQNVAPECVTPGVDNEDGTMKTPWAVDASALIPAMIKAIQELSAQVTALQAKVGA